MILGVAGSGSVPSNSRRLLEEALAGAAEARPVERRVECLADLRFRGCVGCRACRTGADGCVLQDDLTPVLRATAECSALVLATPIYYGYASGLFKSYLDRWYSFRDAGRNLRVPSGRPALLIVTQGHPEPEAYAWTLGSLERVLASYGFEPRALVATGLEEAGAADRSPEILSRARDLGRALTS
ncbi:flavodoxin family protein [Deferrisoma camini]|uniref:flavodoxin family protein n=1 Tax=Deferrisoma camini TaxID=1035120 RepID=UPI00046D6F97|nr:flavodoxin family protein [Deferrisoma camini]